MLTIKQLELLAVELTLLADFIALIAFCLAEEEEKQKEAEKSKAEKKQQNDTASEEKELVVVPPHIPVAPRNDVELEERVQNLEIAINTIISLLGQLIKE